MNKSILIIGKQGSGKTRKYHEIICTLDDGTYTGVEEITDCDELERLLLAAFTNHKQLIATTQIPLAAIPSRVLLCVEIIDMNEELVLQSHGSERERRYDFKEFGKVIIGPGHVQFWESFLELPSFVKVGMAGISESDMQKFIHLKYNELIDSLLNYLRNKNWRYRESGERVMMDDIVEYSLNIQLPTNKFISAIKKHKYSLEEMQRMISVFEDQTILYIND